MSKVVTVDRIPLKLKGDGGEFRLQLADPGIVRAFAFTLEKKLIYARGDAAFDEVLSMFVEYIPNAPMRNRMFVAIGTGAEPLKVPDTHNLVFVGSAISGNTGRTSHLYEIVELKK